MASSGKLPSLAPHPAGSAVKNIPPANTGDVHLIPGLGRSPEEGSGNPLQYSCLENSVDRGAWQAPRGLKESDSTEATWHALQVTPPIAGKKKKKAKCNQAGPQGRKQAGGTNR